MVQDYRQPRSYELMTVLIPDLDEDATTTQIDRVKSLVSAQGEIVATLQSSPWGRRRLAYPIRHNSQDYRDGYYLLMYFTALPDKTAELERDLKLDPQVIRYLLLQSEPYEAPIEEAPEGAPEAGAEAAAAAETANTAAPEQAVAATQEESAEGTVAETEDSDDQPRPTPAEDVSAPADDDATAAVAESTTTVASEETTASEEG